MGFTVASQAAQSGALVELVGKVGDGADGDAILLSVAQAGIGHVAVIRSVGGAVIRDGPDGPESSGSLEALAGLDGSETGDEPQPGGTMPVAGPALDAGDVELALRYLPDYDVVVIAEPLDDAATAAVAAAAQWANARLIAIGTADEAQLPADATVLAAPSEEGESAFASVVGRYAAALDRGEEPGEAFATASRDLGWTRIGSE